MDRGTGRFGMPGGGFVAGLFGGAVVLAALAVAAAAGLIGTATSALRPELVVALSVAALVVVLASAAALVGRLRSTAETLARSSREAEQAATRLRVLVEHVPAAVYIDMADPDIADGGRLAYMSPRITGILGYEPEAFVNDPELWPGLIHADDREEALAAYANHWRTSEPLRAEYRMVARDGAIVWVRDEAYAMLDDTRSGHQVSQGLLIDITDRKLLEAKLVHDALHDPLTGLANRVLLREHLGRWVARQARNHEKIALLFVDLDDFKPINDSYGHAAGDEILVEVARRLQAAVRAEDVVARQSGDEFAILLGDVRGDDQPTATAERILRELRRPIQLGAASIVVGGSIGIAIGAPDDAMPADDLLIRADAAMYAAKAAGKGGFEIYQPTMPVRTWRELEAAG